MLFACSILSVIAVCRPHVYAPKGMKPLILEVAAIDLVTKSMNSFSDIVNLFFHSIDNFRHQHRNTPCPLVTMEFII